MSCCGKERVVKKKPMEPVYAASPVVHKQVSSERKKIDIFSLPQRVLVEEWGQAGVRGGGEGQEAGVEEDQFGGGQR